DTNRRMIDDFIRKLLTALPDSESALTRLGNRISSVSLLRHMLTGLVRIRRIVRPYTEPPADRAHEVRVILRNPQVVNRLVPACIDQFFDRHPLPIVAAQQVTRLQV